VGTPEPDPEVSAVPAAVPVTGDRWTRRFPALVAGLVVLALVLRVATIDVQGLWLDEIFTVGVLDGGLGHVWSTIRETENTPPLYYLLAWGWRQVVGSGDVDLRLLSALLGALAVWPAALLGRRLAGPARGAAAGLLTGLLLAVNPLAHWMGQEARAYALVLLAAGVAWLALLAALDRPTAARLWGWTAAAAVLAWSHYFGLLLLALGWALLLRRLRVDAPSWRTALAAAVGPLAVAAVAAAALAPIALAQRSTGMYNGIAGGGGLLERTIAGPKQFAVGYSAPIEDPLGLALLVALAAVLLAGADAVRGRAGGGRLALVVALVAAVWVVPELVALAGFDVVLSRNLLLLMPATWAVVAVAAAHGPRWSRWLLVAVAAVQVGVVAWVAATPGGQRDDWRGPLRDAAAGGTPQLLLVGGDKGLPVAHYRPRTRPYGQEDAAGLTLRSIAVIDRPPTRDQDAPPVDPVPPPPAPGMRLVRAESRDQWRLYVWSAPTPVRLTAAQVVAIPGFAGKVPYVDP